MHLLQDGFKGAGLQHISKDYILNININMPAPSLQEQITHQMRLIDSNDQWEKATDSVF